VGAWECGRVDASVRPFVPPSIRA